MSAAVRLLGGITGTGLYLLGRGARLTGLQIDSAADYYVGMALQLAGAATALLVFVVWKRSRLAGPAPERSHTNPRSVGWILIAMGGIAVGAAASLVILGVTAEPVMSGLAADLLGVPGVLETLLVGLLAIGSGATALGRGEGARDFVLASAPAVALVFPLGLMAAAWGAWSTLGWARPGRSDGDGSSGGRRRHAPC